MGGDIMFSLFSKAKRENKGENNQIQKSKQDIKRCHGCHFAHWSMFDPSPYGISLSSGGNWEFDCMHPDAKNFPGTWGINEECKCFSEPQRGYCKKHGIYDLLNGCQECILEACEETS
jgi:hypothetical protein